MMTGPGDESAVAQKVLFAVERQQHLSVLASMLAQAQAYVGDPDELGAIIAMSPGLTLALLQATHATWQKGGTLSVERLVRGLKPRSIRSLLLGADLYGENEPAGDVLGDIRLRSRQALVLHSVSVALCARKIAQMEKGPQAGDIAYISGLFHDCGKLALEQAMPKGYAQVLEQTALDHCGSLHAERSLLSTDHTVLGRRLIQRWGLPEAVAQAAWLHHSPSVSQLYRLSGHEVAHWVRLANILVNAGDDVEIDASFAHIMDWPQDRIALVKEYLEQRLPAVQAVVEQDQAEAMAQLARQTRHLAREVGLEEQRLHHEQTQLQAEQVHLQAMQQLLTEAPAAGLVEAATALAHAWQHQFQTGAVGVITLERNPQALGTMVLCGNFGQRIETLMEVPEEARSLWTTQMNGPLIHTAEDQFDWLFCQLELSLDLSRMQWLILADPVEVLGVLFFEQNYPADTLLFEDRYRELARAGAVLLQWQRRLRHEGRLSEGLVEGLSRPSVAPHPPTTSEPSTVSPEFVYEGLGELAAGFAHELNNPLSVVMGRCELLSQQTQDPETRASLQLILDNAAELASLVESLMGFAEPPSPRPQVVAVEDLIHEAMALAGNKLGMDSVDVQVDMTEQDIPQLWLDSAQVVAALSNLLVNAIEAYPSGPGPVVLHVTRNEPQTLDIRIEDQGAGMSEETLKKALFPFYSAKPAGRKRGMGLSFAARLIHLNGGTVTLDSQPSQGTTVLLRLPVS